MSGGLIGADGWANDVLDRLDRRLNASDRSPVAVAVSGGGDSLALLRLARVWATRRRRPLVALTVDHQLQPESAEWSRFVGKRAAQLGVAHQSLSWTGAKPRAGLPAAARRARHALLADAARRAGARVILMGHTADDRLEAAEMRQDGARVPTPVEWAPSPAWPEGRGVFLLRPLLGVRRAELRRWLAACFEAWIEDPANDDVRYGRARARQRLAGASAAPLPFIEPDPPSLEGIAEGLGGELTALRATLVAAPRARRRLGAMMLCAAGAVRPPRSDALERLLQRLERPGAFTATLAGARIERRGDEVMVCREAGEQTRRPFSGGILPTGESVFDGRFLMCSAAKGNRVVTLRGSAGRLPAAERRRLTLVPAGARGALPLVLSGEEGSETVSCPLLAQTGSTAARPLALSRLRAALGAFGDEASLGRVAEVDAGA